MISPLNLRQQAAEPLWNPCRTCVWNLCGTLQSLLAFAEPSVKPLWHLAQTTLQNLCNRCGPRTTHSPCRKSGGTLPQGPEPALAEPGGIFVERCGSLVEPYLKAAPQPLWTHWRYLAFVGARAIGWSGAALRRGSTIPKAFHECSTRVP